MNIFSSRFSHAQDSEYDSLLAVYLKLDSIWLAEIENDSLNIFSLMDSLTSAAQSSQLSLRSSYNSQVYNAGRDYGIDQNTMGGGLSYYHKSGLYADISGQYYSEISPHYNATNVTIGYSNFLSTEFAYNLSIGHTFYHELNESASFNNTLNNGLGLGAFYYSKYVTFGLDYTYSFGSDGIRAHRLVPSLMIAPKLKARGVLSKFKFNPIIYATIGSETIYTEQYNNLVIRNLISKFGREAFFRALRNENEDLLNLISETTESDYFGALNLQFTFPLKYTHKNFSGILSYNLNLPNALPDEILEETMNGYFGVSVYYLINL